MIHEEKCYVGTCDNCGETFEHYHEGWTMFADENDLREEMDNASWYTGDTDPDYEGKHYCRACFKPHPEDDDKIIVDESRKKSNP